MLENWKFEGEIPNLLKALSLIERDMSTFYPKGEVEVDVEVDVDVEEIGTVGATGVVVVDVPTLALPKLTETASLAVSAITTVFVTTSNVSSNRSTLSPPILYLIT